MDLKRRCDGAGNGREWAGRLGLGDENGPQGVKQGGRGAGRARCAGFLECMNVSNSEQLKSIVGMANEKGDRAAAEYVVHGVYKATDEGLPLAQGQAYVLPGGAFFDVAHGKITRVSNYYNLEDWLGQVRRVDLD